MSEGGSLLTVILLPMPAAAQAAESLPLHLPGLLVGPLLSPELWSLLAILSGLMGVLWLSPSPSDTLTHGLRADEEVRWVGLWHRSWTVQALGARPIALGPVELVISDSEVGAYRTPTAEVPPVRLPRR